MSPSTGASIGDRLVRLGAAVFGIGVVFTLVVVGPFVAGASWQAPLGLDLLTLLLPVGLGLALLGLLVSARQHD